MKRNREFAVFVLTHGRPDRVHTFKSLRDGGYTGRIFLIVDDRDNSRDEYIQRFGKDSVIVFDKARVGETFDHCDNFNDPRSPVFARNASFKIARELGLTHFVQLDDDYKAWRWAENDRGQYVTDAYMGNLDSAFDSVARFLDRSGAHSVAFGQGGDFIGGADSHLFRQIHVRKVMNVWFCRVDRPFDFIGILNDDVNTYCIHGSRGMLFFTFRNCRVEQIQTQSNADGLTEIYLDRGTYVKSFYTVMICPSFCKVSLVGSTRKRLHHKISWNAAVPKILSQSLKKGKHESTK